VLETELRYAWRALDMLSQEYVKMWERLEKLEILLFEQQTVIGQLLEFYTSSDFQSLMNKDSASSAKAVENNSNSEIRIPDEAFYRSLNTAHRDNLAQVHDVGDPEAAATGWLQSRDTLRDFTDPRRFE
ncbi:hypothetical protein FHG87_006192, partial [Trinorchestia longiramus]